MKLARPVSTHKRVPHGGPFSANRPNPDILDFSSSISPAGSPPLVRKHLRQNLGDIHTYPDPDSAGLKKSLKWYTGVPLSGITVGNGATEIIYNFCRAFLGPRTKVLIPAPTFGEYEAAARLQDSQISFFKSMDLRQDLDEFVSRIPVRGCVFLCNPNNPTGTILHRGEVARIVEKARRKSALVLVDECFIELVPGPDRSVVALSRKCDNLVVLRSLTKSFALAGIRVGYALGPPSLIDTLERIKIPWSVSGPAQRAAGAALCHAFYLERAKKIISRESEFLKSKISRIDGFECGNNAANFILVRTRLRSGVVWRKLLRRGILVRDCSSFRGMGEHHIRVAVRTRAENQKLVQAMKLL